VKYLARLSRPLPIPAEIHARPRSQRQNHNPLNLNAGVTYAQVAERLKEHGLEETEASVTSKLARGTFSATFMLAALAALELEGILLEDI
jgi:hypothetical protein